MAEESGSSVQSDGVAATGAVQRTLQIAATIHGNNGSRRRRVIERSLQINEWQFGRAVKLRARRRSRNIQREVLARGIRRSVGNLGSEGVCALLAGCSCKLSGRASKLNSRGNGAHGDRPIVWRGSATRGKTRRVRRIHRCPRQ